MRDGRRARNDEPMKKSSGRKSDEMRPEYDFSKGVRGKYAGKVVSGKSLVLLDPDVAKEFPDSESVNRALRAILVAVPARRTRKRRTA